MASELNTFKKQVTQKDRELEEVKNQAVRERDLLVKRLQDDSLSTQQNLISQTETLMREKREADQKYQQQKSEYERL